MRALASLPVAVALAVLAAGCEGAPAAAPTLSAIPSPATPIPSTGPYVALALVPTSATTVTVANFDQLRVRFGVPDLTSSDPMSDRLAFWEQVDDKAVALTGGLFRAESSTWELDYGFTEDDVDWEVHWTGPDGSGYAVGFRPDLDLAGVDRAVRREPALEGALLVRHVLEKGQETDGHSWADDPMWGDYVVGDAETAYLRQGCVPLDRALADAAVDDAKAQRVREIVPDLEPLDRWSVSFADGIVTALIGGRRGDVVARTDLGDQWPRTRPMSFVDGFAQPLDDPRAGRIGYQVVDPHAAAALTLGEGLPFPVCNVSIPVIEPTGL